MTTIYGILFGVLALWTFTDAIGVGAEESVVKYNLNDFYYYDEQGTTQPLIMASKISVRFARLSSESERDKFISKFSPLTVKKDVQDAARVVLEFPSSMPPHRITEILGEVAGSGFAEATPIVYVDNVEALADGIVVEPKSYLSVEAVEKRLRKFGEFKIRQNKLEHGAWVLLIDEVQPPLHMYILANLVHKDAWVKRAYPHFRFLHLPIMATLGVEPISGTIDETRRATLTIKVFDPAIKVREDLLLSFGEGSFSPAGVPPLFFSVLEEKDPTKRRREFSDARSRTIILSWQFRQYAIGEWNIVGQKVTYEKQSERLVVISTQITFVVTSLIGSLAIDDMPPPKILETAQFKPGSSFVSTGADPPHFWYERWIANPSFSYLMVRYSRWAMYLLMAVSTYLVGLVCWRYGRPLLKNRRAKERFIRDCLRRCEEARTHVSRDGYLEALSVLQSILHAVLPDALPPHANIAQLKDEDIRKEFDDNTWPLLLFFYEAVGEVHSPHFVPDASMLGELCDTVNTVLRRLVPKISAVEGVRQ